MRRLLMLTVVLLAPLAVSEFAEAHFLWVTADPSACCCQGARVTFGEVPDSGEAELIGRIENTKLWADGKALKVSKADDCLEAALPEPRPNAIDAVCDYGVVTKRGPAFLLQYAARTQATPQATDGASGEAADHPRLVWLAETGKTPIVRALWRGKGIANATVKVAPDEGEPREVQTNDQGDVPVADLNNGTTLLLKVVENTPGSRDGRDYTEVRHYATLTVNASDSSTKADKGSESADQVLQRAHDSRANWGPDFPGFTADLTVRMDDKAVHGTVDVSEDGALTLDLPSGPAKDWAKSQLRSIVMHRGLNGPTQLEPGASFLEPENDHPLGRLIKLPDGAMGSAYRIKGDEIREVNRRSKDNHFSDRILANQKNAEGKLLPLAYTVGYWDNTTNELKKVETFHATWTRVGRLDLPKTHMQVKSEDGKTSVRELELSNHRLKTSPTRAATK
ncbi:MAG: DUF3386 family protein [Isosphaeraceae bacterium]